MIPKNLYCYNWNCFSIKPSPQSGTGIVRPRISDNLPWSPRFMNSSRPLQRIFQALYRLNNICCHLGILCLKIISFRCTSATRENQFEYRGRLGWLLTIYNGFDMIRGCATTIKNVFCFVARGHNLYVEKKVMEIPSKIAGRTYMYPFAINSERSRLSSNKHRYLTVDGEFLCGSEYQSRKNREIWPYMQPCNLQSLYIVSLADQHS